MAAGGFREFVAGETLDEDKINDFLMQGMLVFGGTAARGSAIPSPVHGQFSFLTDSDTVAFYDGSDWVEFESGPLAVNFVVVGGGASGGSGDAGGGGAGGYRSSIVGELTGGSAVAEAPAYVIPGTYPIVVGAGGALVNGAVPGNPGNPSAFGPIVSLGGGRGGRNTVGGAGGSGGGGGDRVTVPKAGGPGFPNQGFKGGDCTVTDQAGGGGGAGSAGANGTAGTNNAGGVGISSSVTGSAVTRAAGGRGDVVTGSVASGAANSGNGGDGSNSSDQNSGAGGSGVVIFSVPVGTSISFSGGVTETNSTVGSNRVYVVTAAGPTDTVTIG